eukprot:gene9128-11184_t
MSTINKTTSSYKQVGYSGREYFQQQSPMLGNQYLEDTFLLESLKRVLPNDVLKSIEPDLIRFGDRVVTDILQHGRNSENNPPKLVQYDAWGKRIDKIVVDESWNILKNISAEEGLVGIGYERKQKEYSRIYQYIKLYLFSCSSAVFDCPLSMTDGGARLIERFGDKEMMSGPYQHFITRDPKNFWTSGQWMTEKTGGSDVAGTETIAIANTTVPNATHLATGFKYFTSATTSDSAIILARDATSDNKMASGSGGLSAFFVKIRNQDGDLNGIRIHKLKNKFGTKAVPTAELELIDSPVTRIGPKGRGVPVIASILNITRIHNVIHSVGTMRRSVAIARDFAHRRKVFASNLSENLLYLTTLAEMELEYRAGLLFLLDVSHLLGKSECLPQNKKTESLLRIITPLSKLYTAKQSIAVSSEGIECLGGTGYMEDSDLPRLLRDTQVTSIWEGTTNVLAMDVWRSIKSHDSLRYLLECIEERIDSYPENLKYSRDTIVSAIARINAMAAHVTRDGDIQYAEGNARRFAFLISQAYMASLLVEHAKWSKKSLDADVANRWCFLKLKAGVESNDVVWSINGDEKWRQLDRMLALDIDENGNCRGYGDLDINGKPRAKY